MSKKRLYVRPKNPASPEAQDQALEALVKWGMECKADFESREARKRAGQRGSTPPPSPAPMAAKSK